MFRTGTIPGEMRFSFRALDPAFAHPYDPAKLLAAGPNMLCRVDWPKEDQGMSKRIAVVGAGAVGGYVGASLAHAGHDVTLIDPKYPLGRSTL